LWPRLSTPPDRCFYPVSTLISSIRWSPSGSTVLGVLPSRDWESSPPRFLSFLAYLSADTPCEWAEDPNFYGYVMNLTEFKWSEEYDVTFLKVSDPVALRAVRLNQVLLMYDTMPQRARLLHLAQKNEWLPEDVQSRVHLWFNGYFIDVVDLPAISQAGTKRD